MSSYIVTLNCSVPSSMASSLLPASVSGTHSIEASNDNTDRLTLPMRSPVRRTQSEISLSSSLVSPTTMQSSRHRPAHVEDSIEIDDLDDEPFSTARSIPTALRVPSQSSGVRPQLQPVGEVSSTQPFKPSLDTTKNRYHSTGFNRLRLSSVQPMSHKFKSSTNSKLRDLINEVQPKTESSPLAADESYDPSNTSANSGGSHAELKRSRSVSMGGIPSHSPVRVEFKKRRVHDSSKGPSMTPSAIDYRERKRVAAEYQEKFGELLDDDIVQDVEAEGWLTPIGRLLKAGVRQLERVEEERQIRLESIPLYQAPGHPLSEDTLQYENTVLRIENKELKKKLDRLRQSLRRLIEEEAC